MNGPPALEAAPGNGAQADLPSSVPVADAAAASGGGTAAEPTAGAAADPSRAGWRRQRRVFLAAFGVFFALCAAWSLCTPLGSAPDEPSHLVKAAATARGEINGVSGFLTQQMVQGPTLQPTHFYRVPEAYGQLSRCYVQASPEACLKPIRHSDLTAVAPTTAGHYNPIYYAAVGWPSLIFTGEHGMYLIRLMSALLNSLLLAGALTIAAQWRRPSFVLVGLIAAATPMLLYLDGVVNPNGIEASSAVLAWTAALSLAMQPDRDLFRGRMISLGVAVSVLANARPLGFEWTAAILAVSVLVAGKGAVRMIVRDRLTWLVSGAAAGPMLFGLIWTLTHGDNAKVPFVPGNAFWAAAHTTLTLTQAYINSMIGVFGWLDTVSPAVTYLFWTGAVIMLMVLSCAFGRLRENVAVLATLLGLVFIPVVAQAVQAKNLGLVWQGRYLLAFAAGLPLLAGMVTALRATAVPERAQRRIALVVMVILCFANITAFFHTLRRYMVGLNGRVLFRPIIWEPPGTWMFWLPVYAIALAALVILVARLSLSSVADPEPSVPTPLIGGQGSARPRLSRLF